MAENNEDSGNNGVNGETSSPEFLDDTDFPPLKSPQTPSVIDSDRLRTRIEELESDRAENESRIKELQAELDRVQLEKKLELDTLRADKESVFVHSEINRKAAEAAAKRAAELEGELARLQHDFISACNDAAEATKEVQKLNAEMTELKAEKDVVEVKVKSMEITMEQLVKKYEDSEMLIAEFTKKFAEEDVKAETVVDGGHQEWKGMKEKLPVFGAVTVGLLVVAAGVVCHVRFSRN